MECFTIVQLVFNAAAGQNLDLAEDQTLTFTLGRSGRQGHICASGRVIHAGHEGIKAWFPVGWQRDAVWIAQNFVGKPGIGGAGGADPVGGGADRADGGILLPQRLDFQSADDRGARRHGRGRRRDHRCR